MPKCLYFGTYLFMFCMYVIIHFSNKLSFYAILGTMLIFGALWHFLLNRDILCVFLRLSRTYNIKPWVKNLHVQASTTLHMSSATTHALWMLEPKMLSMAILSLSLFPSQSTLEMLSLAIPYAPS